MYSNDEKLLFFSQFVKNLKNDSYKAVSCTKTINFLACVCDMEINGNIHEQQTKAELSWHECNVEDIPIDLHWNQLYSQ